MIASAAVALRAAIHSTLSGDAALVAMLGGARVYDVAPRGAALPYVTFGDWQTRDWSTATDTGAEHFIQINAWSEQGGAAEALTIAERVRALLHEQSLTLDGHRLIDLRFTQVDARRETSARFTRATSRFRATTEFD